MEAKFKHGNPSFIRYTRGTAIAAGEVIIVGETVGIAHNNFAANEEANLSIGPGVYEVVCGEAIAVGLRVGWDDSADKVLLDDNVSSDVPFGFMNLVNAATVDTDVREVLFIGTMSPEA